MSNPHVNLVVMHGKKIYSVETAAGVVHFVAEELHEHLSDALRSLRPAPNPVVQAMEAEAIPMIDGTGEVKDSQEVVGDVSESADDKLED